MCVRVRACVCVRVCVRACVRVLVRVRVCISGYVRVHLLRLEAIVGTASAYCDVNPSTSSSVPQRGTVERTVDSHVHAKLPCCGGSCNPGRRRTVHDNIVLHSGDGSGHCKASAHLHQHWKEYLEMKKSHKYFNLARWSAGFTGSHCVQSINGQPLRAVAAVPCLRREGKSVSLYS